VIWVPPPVWIIAILLAFGAHIVVIGIIFYARGWKRGALAIPLGLIMFVLTVVAGAALDAAVWQLDPLPLLIVLAAGIYGAYALMMWRRKPAAGEQTHAA
jgi:hypothetical protein